MSNLGLPLGISVSELLQASELSENAATADFLLVRVFPILIYVKTDDDAAIELADELARTAELMLDKFGYELVGQWGPFEGSRFITLFGRGNEPERSEGFRKGLEKFNREFSSQVAQVYEAYINGKPRKGVLIAACVGTIAIICLGGPATAALTLHLPVQVLQSILITAPADKVAELVGQMFVGRIPPPWRQWK